MLRGGRISRTGGGALVWIDGGRKTARGGAGLRARAQRLSAKVIETAAVFGLLFRRTGDFRKSRFDVFGNIAFRTVPNDRILIGLFERDNLFGDGGVFRNGDYDLGVNDQNTLLTGDVFGGQF